MTPPCGSGELFGPEAVPSGKSGKLAAGNGVTDANVFDASEVTLVWGDDTADEASSCESWALAPDAKRKTNTLKEIAYFIAYFPHSPRLTLPFLI